MCYYSKSMRAGTYRNATFEDDIVMASDLNGHHFARSAQDGMILCMPAKTEVHIASLRVKPEHVRSFSRNFPMLAGLIGLPVSGTFHETGSGRSNDSFFVDRNLLPFAYFEDGMEFYIGPKRPTLESKLGTDDPSIALDHRIDTPTFETV